MRVQVVLGAVALLWVFGWLLGQCGYNSHDEMIKRTVRDAAEKECRVNPSLPACRDL